MHCFTKQGATENKLTVCGDVCYPPTLDPCVFVRIFPRWNFQRSRRFILEFLNDSLAAAGVSKATVIGKGDLNGGCQRGKLSAATGIHFTL